MDQPLKIKLNEEQSRKFLSFFVKEATQIAIKRALAQQAQKEKAAKTS
ncbi:hypothetical protein [Desulfofalx alkaliphila]|nr:hypothetical protein [Desulfofalx alkaliphila]